MGNSFTVTSVDFCGRQSFSPFSSILISMKVTQMRQGNKELVNCLYNTKSKSLFDCINHDEQCLESISGEKIKHVSF